MANDFTATAELVERLRDSTNAEAADLIERLTDRVNHLTNINDGLRETIAELRADLNHLLAERSA